MVIYHKTNHFPSWRFQSHLKNISHIESNWIISLGKVNMNSFLRTTTYLQALGWSSKYPPWKQLVPPEKWYLEDYFFWGEGQVIDHLLSPSIIYW